jgi:DNA-damage-inducible protein J
MSPEIWRHVVRGLLQICQQHHPPADRSGRAISPEILIVCRAQMEHSCAMKAKVEKHGSHRRRQSVKTAMVRLRIPQERKDRAEEILHLLGLTPTQVVNVLFAQIVAYKAVPFRIGLPNDGVTVPIEHVAKVWNSLDDTDYSYLNDPSAVEGA